MVYAIRLISKIKNMIAPLALAITLSFDKHVINNQHYEKYSQKNIVNLSQPVYHTTKDINPDPYEYMKQKDQDIIYKQILDDLNKE